MKITCRMGIGIAVAVMLMAQIASADVADGSFTGTMTTNTYVPAAGVDQGWYTANGGAGIQNGKLGIRGAFFRQGARTFGQVWSGRLSQEFTLSFDVLSSSYSVGGPFGTTYGLLFRLWGRENDPAAGGNNLRLDETVNTPNSGGWTLCSVDSAWSPTTGSPKVSKTFSAYSTVDMSKLRYFGVQFYHSAHSQLSNAQLNNAFVNIDNLSIVPEPATAGLLAVSGLVIALYRRVRKNYGF